MLPSISKRSEKTLTCGKASWKPGRFSPVDGAALVVEQAGRAERVGGGAQRADLDAAIVLLAQPCRERLGVVALDIETAANEDDGRPVLAEHQLALLLDGGVDGNLHAVRCSDGLACLAGQTPGIGFVAEDAIGAAQRLDRRGKGDHREFRLEVEDDCLRQRRCVRHRANLAPVACHNMKCRFHDKEPAISGAVNKNRQSCRPLGREKIGRV
jgi:hypothetical protein